MSTITAFIAEDEPLARETLEDWIAQTPALKLIGQAGDGQTALEQINALKPALAFMDINMPGMTGLEVVRQLSHHPGIIFTTAYDQYAVTAFELHAVDYLLKPFSKERFDDAVERALQTLQQHSGDALHAQAQSSLEELDKHQGVRDTSTAGNPDGLLATPNGAPLTRILVRDQGRIFPLNVDEIEYLRSDTKYTSIAARGKSFLVRLAIATFEEKLDPQRFVRVHRSHIINMDFVDSMRPDEQSQLIIKMRDGTELIASREVSKKLRDMAI